MTFEEFKQRHSLRLTVQQEEAVKAVDGRTLILAVPGSGKTTVIVSRLGYMIKCLGVSPEKLLTLTYSVASCRDMKERYVQLFGKEGSIPEFRTINGICAIIIRQYERTKGAEAFRLMEADGESTEIIKGLFREIRGEYPTLNDIREIKSKITYIRNMLLSKEELERTENMPEGFSELFDAYREYKRKNRLMDYDDQLEYARKILIKYPDILEYFSTRFRYISVDEAQDTSKIQHEIIAMLVGKNGNIFMVGDEDQSIYGFRAAYPAALLDFEKLYGSGRVLFIEQNFRCTGKIVASAKKIIENNTKRRRKNMFTENFEGEDIKIIKLSDYRKQPETLLRLCSVFLQREETTAVLFRNNELILPFCDLLERNGIPYSCRDLENLFFTSAAVSECLMLLQLCVDCRDAEAFVSLAPKLGCGISKALAKDIVRYSETHAVDVWKAMCVKLAGYSYSQKRSAELYEVIKAVRNKDALSALQMLYRNTCFGKFLDKRFSDSSKILVLMSLAQKCTDIRDFLSHMETLSRKADAGKRQENRKLILSSVHSSKGLEYDNVIIIDAKDGVFPAVSKTDKESLKDELEEERRLFYVALTRARKRVTILTYEREFGLSSKPFTFVTELISAKNTGAKKERASLLRKVEKPVLKKRAKRKVDLTGFVLGAEILHIDYGEGEITEYDGADATVFFPQLGLSRKFRLDISVSSGYIRLKKN